MDSTAKNRLLFVMFYFICRHFFWTNDDSTDYNSVLMLLNEGLNEQLMEEEDERRGRFWAYIRNRTDAEQAFFALVHVAVDGENRERRWWEKPKSRDWWENIVLQEWDDEDWLLNFRMTRGTFDYIANALTPHIQKQDTIMRTALTVEHRLAITLWRLATNIEFRSLGHLFGVGRSTACTITHEICRAIEQHLMPQHIRFPQGQELTDGIQRFNTKHGFPQVAGAIDGTHIPIRAPTESKEDYFNRKQYYSIVLQAVVNADGHFIDTFVGYPGSVHDARVFKLSPIRRRMIRGNLFPNTTVRLGGQDIPILLLGDPAYPLMPNLMKPYTGAGLTRDQRHFNKKLSSARFSVEHAFGRLKGRWRILNKQNDSHLAFNRPLVHACCTLHNICETFGDPFNQHWLFRVNNVRLQRLRQRAQGVPFRMREGLKAYLRNR